MVANVQINHEKEVAPEVAINLKLQPLERSCFPTLSNPLAWRCQSRAAFACSTSCLQQH